MRDTVASRLRRINRICSSRVSENCVEVEKGEMCIRDRLVVTLVILSILFAIAVPSLLGYIHLSQFRKNESYAKTMYLSAESELTYLRTGGEWESFCSKVKKEGVLNQSFDESDEAVSYTHLAVHLLEQLGAKVVKVVCLLELKGLHGRDRIKTCPAETVVAYEGK